MGGRRGPRCGALRRGRRRGAARCGAVRAGRARATRAARHAARSLCVPPLLPNLIPIYLPHTHHHLTFITHTTPRYDQTHIYNK